MIDALDFLEKRLSLLLKRVRILSTENEQYSEQVAHLNAKISSLEAQLLQKESVQLSCNDNKQAHAIIDGLIERIDSIMESSH
jgi:hypothetical protein